MSFSVSLAMTGQDTRLAPAAARVKAAICGGGRLRGLASGVARRGREVRGARERAVEARPALAVGEALLKPIEAPQRAPEVVDHVYERGLARARRDWAAVLQLSVVAEHDVEDRLGGLRREVLDLLDGAAHAEVAQRDLALELAGVREGDGPSVLLVGLDLADVVKQRASYGHVAIDGGEGGRHGAHALGNGER